LTQGLYALRDLIVDRALAGLAQPEPDRVAAGAARLPTRPRSARLTSAAGPHIPAQSGPSDSRARTLILDVADIAVEFTGRRVLDGASLQVAQGEIVGLIGSNGAGKSTLMNVISGFTRPVAGSVRFEGDDLLGLSPHQRARLGIGRVFQDARLFSELTLRETVSVALEAHERSEFLPSLLALPPLPARRAAQAGRGRRLHRLPRARPVRDDVHRRAQHRHAADRRDVLPAGSGRSAAAA
ncbi:MAG: transporter, partial [Frankiales bacterium]|nr:transporter [Frankiales bacterium]